MAMRCPRCDGKEKTENTEEEERNIENGKVKIEKEKMSEEHLNV